MRRDPVRYYGRLPRFNRIVVAAFTLVGLLLGLVFVGAEGAIVGVAFGLLAGLLAGSKPR